MQPTLPLKTPFNLQIIGALILAFASIVLPIFGEARHIKGGWLEYRFISKSGSTITYELTAHIYRDCTTPAPGQDDTQIPLTIFNNNVTVRTILAPLINSKTLNLTEYSECINPKPVVCYVIKEYQVTVQLDETQNGYEVGFQRCCRINGIENLMNPSDNFGNSYTISIPGNRSIVNAPQNSSPVFTGNDLVVVCYDSEFELDFGATDADGDKLEYSLTAALNGASRADPVPSMASLPPYSSVTYANGYNAQRPFGTDITIDSKTGKITGRSAAIAGEYVLAVMVSEYRNNIKIASTRKELHINVAGCVLTKADLPVKFVTCDGFTFKFENGSNSSNITSYLWDFGDPASTVDQSTSPSPSYTYQVAGNYPVSLVVNKGTQCESSANMLLGVFPGYFPNFEFSSGCILNPVEFNDLTETNYGMVNNWKWDFGVPNSTIDVSSQKQPSFLFPQPGTYTVKLVVGSNLGCLDSSEKEIVVFNQPPLSLSFEDALICSSDELKLNASSTSGVSFSWTPNRDIRDANTANPVVSPKSNTVYTVTASKDGCESTKSVNVRVLDFITLSLPADTTICLTDPVQIEAKSQGTSFKWEPAHLFTQPNTAIMEITPVDETTVVTVTAKLGNCAATDNMTIKAIPYPNLDAGEDRTICHDEVTQLNAVGDGFSFAWAPAETLTTPNQASTSAQPTETTKYYVTSYGDRGCPKPKLDSILITVRPVIQVNAGNDTTVLISQPLQLFAQHNADNVSWTPDIALNNSNIENPLAIFESGTLPNGVESVLYTVVATTREGCSATDYLLVKVYKTNSSLLIPSAFTPNNDHLNDIFRPTVLAVRRLRGFRIFNRYGNLVFETTQIGAGWDGRYKGTLQPAGTYVYVCEYIDFNGASQTIKGTFELIR